MPVIQASGLTKHIGGRTLFSDVSFKLERGERMTLSGRNGSGKTTLLRMIAGEAGLDAGTIAFGKGAASPCTTSARLRSSATLREYVTGGLDWIAAIERELGELEARMVDGDAGEATLCGRTPTRRRGLSTRAAIAGATASRRRCAASASATTSSTARSTASRAAS